MDHTVAAAAAAASVAAVVVVDNVARGVDSARCCVGGESSWWARTHSSLYPVGLFAAPAIYDDDDDDGVDCKLNGRLRELREHGERIV